MIFRISTGLRLTFVSFDFIFSGLSTLSKHSISNNNKPNTLQLNTKYSKAKNTEADSLVLPSSPVEDFPIVENWLKNIPAPSQDGPKDLDDPSAADLDLVDPKLDQIKTEQDESNNDKLETREDNLQNSEDVEDSLHLTGILSQTQDESQEFDTKDLDGAEKLSVQPNSFCKPESDEVQSSENADVVAPTSGDKEKLAGDAVEAVKENEQGTDEKTTSNQADKEEHNDSQNLTELKSDNTMTLVAEMPQSQTPQDNQMASTPATGQPTDSSNKMTSAAKRRQLLIEASLEKVKSFTPRLEGSPEAVIDLDGSGDESEAGPVLAPGLKKLMDRFAEHSKRTHIRKKKARQVEVR